MDAIRKPFRIRLAARISAAVIGAVVRIRPVRLRYWVMGYDYWEPNHCKAIGATVCRLLGHDWQPCVPGEGRTATLFMCSGCTATWSSDDWSAFDPDTREGRDAAVLTVWDYLEVLEARHQRYATRARELITAHAEHTIRRAVEAHAEHAALDDYEDGVPFSPTFADYDLWDGAGLNWKAIRERMSAPEPSDSRP